MSVYDRVQEHGVSSKDAWDAEDDDWETDPEPANPVSEAQQRWGAATLPDDAKDVTNLTDLRESVKSQHDEASAKEFAQTKRQVGESYGQKG